MQAMKRSLRAVKFSAAFTVKLLLQTLGLRPPIFQKQYVHLKNLEPEFDNWNIKYDMGF